MFSTLMSDFLWLDLPANVLELFILTGEHPFLLIFLDRKKIFFDIKSSKPEAVVTAPR